MNRGCSIIEQVFDRSEICRVIDQLGDLAGYRTRAGARHLMSLPAVRALATDIRLLGIAREWVGETALPFRATLFDKSPDSNWLIVWHQDTGLAPGVPP